MGFHAFHVNESERRKWQDPESILSEIGLKPKLTFVDLGCGDGFFALPAARMVGEKGRVYALDVDAEAIAELLEKAGPEKLENISARVGAAEDTVLCEKCADIILLSSVLHDFRDPSKVLSNAWKMLAPTGKLFNLDWKKQSMSLGPPVSIRFSEEYARKLIEGAGFKIDAIRPCGEYHYLISAESRGVKVGPLK